MAISFNIPGDPLGKYGRMRLEYLKTEKTAMLFDLAGRDELKSHLCDIDAQATDMMFRIEADYIKRHPLPDSDDFMAVVRVRNTARSIAEECVLHDLIYC